MVRKTPDIKANYHMGELPIDSCNFFNNKSKSMAFCWHWAAI